MQTFSTQYDPKQGWCQTIATLNSPSTLAMVFGGSGSADSDGSEWLALRALLPDAVMIGCSSSGEILDNRVYDDTLTAMIVRFSNSRLRRVQTRVGGPEESRRAGQALAATLALEPELRGVFVVSDGLAVNGSELAAGLHAGLPSSVGVAGGLAGDGDRFQKTWVLADDRPQSGYVTAVGFSGSCLQFLNGCKGGWDKFGIERRVTKACGNKVFELDGRPALALYKEYLGDRVSGLPAAGLLFPLAIRHDDEPGQPLVRTILGVDETAQSLIFAGDVPQGAYAQLMKANFDRLVDGASGAAKAIRLRREASAPSVPPRKTVGLDPSQHLAIAVSCVGRRLVLGERCEEELDATLSELPDGTRQIGFYSYGELAPHQSGGPCEFHNQTMTLTLLAECAASEAASHAN